MGLTVKEFAKRAGISEATVRRRIKAGQLEYTIISGPFGDQYDIPEQELYTASATVDVIPVVEPIRVDEIMNALHDFILTHDRGMDKALGDEMAKLGDEIQGQGDKIDQLQQQIVELKTIIEQQSRKELPAPWWKRIFGKGGANGNTK